MRRSDVVAAATGSRQFDARVDGTVTTSSGSTSTRSTQLLDVDVTGPAASPPSPVPRRGPVDEAKAHRRRSATTVTVETANGAPVDATIVGLFDDQTILGEDYLFDTSVLTAAGVARRRVAGVLDRPRRLAERRSTRSARTVQEYPYASVETADQFRERVDGMSTRC